MTERDSRPTVSAGLLYWVPEFITLSRRRIQRQTRILRWAVLVGIVAGLGGVAFYLATQIVAHYALGEWAGYVPYPRPGGETPLPWLGEAAGQLHPWLLLLIPTLGGLVSGFIIYRYAPEAEGHGTDAAIAAYHHKDGYIRPRVPPIKLVTSAITIGTGGSGGREGPIVQIGAGFGSFLADLVHLRPADRRVLMAAGMGAGIAAIFRAPLAGALFASEVLYWSPEFEPEVILPAGIASVVAYSTFGAFFGWKPLFTAPDLTFSHPWELGPYTLLALGVVILAMLYTRTFYGLTGVFHKLRMAPHFKPAIGAGLTGLVGLALYFAFARQAAVLAVMSFGYGSIQNAMTQEAGASAAILLAIALGKILTTSLTIGSGGSGGVFGPSMVIGGCGGGALGILLHQYWPGLVPHPASFVIVGMAGFFAAAAKTPFSTIVIVSEMTGGYHLLLPSLWVCILAFILSDKLSIYRSQVEGRAHSPAHQGTYIREVLAGVRVNQFLKPQTAVIALQLSDSLDTVIDRFDTGANLILPVVNRNQRLAGIVDIEQVHVASQRPNLGPLVLAADLMNTDVVPLTQDDQLDRAQELFVENDLLALPVVDNLRERRLLGIVRRYDIASVYLRRLHGRPAQAAEQSFEDDVGL